MELSEWNGSGRKWLSREEAGTKMQLQRIDGQNRV